MRERSDLQVRPPLQDAFPVDPVHHHELRAARRTGDEADVALRDAELLRDEAQERLVRGPLHRRHGDARAQRPVGDPVDAVGTAAGRQADGEADVGLAQDGLTATRA